MRIAITPNGGKLVVTHRAWREYVHSRPEVARSKEGIVTIDPMRLEEMGRFHFDTVLRELYRFEECRPPTVHGGDPYIWPSCLAVSDDVIYCTDSIRVYALSHEGQAIKVYNEDGQFGDVCERLGSWRVAEAVRALPQPAEHRVQVAVQLVLGARVEVDEVRRLPAALELVAARERHGRLGAAERVRAAHKLGRVVVRDVGHAPVRVVDGRGERGEDDRPGQRARLISAQLSASMWV